MNTMTSTLTKTSTNTKLAVATAFLAVSAAFAMIPASTTNTRFQGCRDSDAPVGATFDQSQLFVKSQTAYNSGTSTDRCYTFPTTGKTYVMEGVCKNDGFQTWQKNCAELNLGKTGVNYQCIEGACVNVLATTPSSTPWLTVSTATLSVPAVAGTNSSVTIASNASWTVSDNQDWLTVSPLTGSNNGTLGITYAANTATFVRRGVVTVVGGGITQAIEVTQAAASSTATTTTLMVSPTQVTIGAAVNSNNSASVSSNINWTVSESVSWLTVSPMSGSNNGTLTFTASQANTTASSRNGVVTVVGGGITRNITVIQSGVSSTPSSTVSLSVSPTAFSTAALAGTRSISVSSNVSWTVTDNQTWLSVLPVSGLNNGSFVVSYTANTLTTSRTGVVSVIGGGITRTISVTQNAPSSTPTAPTSTYLNATIDTNYTGLRNDHYVLAGTQKHLAGRVQLSAFGEDVELQDLALNVLSASSLANVENTFDSFTIYQDAAMIVPLASVNSSIGTVIFEDVDFVVPKNTTQYLYIGAEVNSIGTGDNGTAISNVSLNFGLKDVGTTAEGVTSHDDVLAQNLVVTENVYTKVMTAIGAQVTNVASNFPGGNLAGGEQTFFTFAVTANAGVNTDNDGDTLDLLLTSLKLQLATDAASVASVKLCRVSTGNCINLVTPSVASSPVALETAAGTGVVQLSGFSNVDDRRINSGETVQFELRGTFSGVTDKYVQGSLQDVNNSGIVWGYDVNNDNVNDVSFTDLKKMEPRWSGYPDVVGMALN